MSESASFRRNPDVSWRTVEGQAVLILNKEGEIQVLNEVGTYVWEHLGETAEEMARNIAAQYDVPQDQALEDVLVFIRELQASGALVANDV